LFSFKYLASHISLRTLILHVCVYRNQEQRLNTSINFDTKVYRYRYVLVYSNMPSSNSTHLTNAFLEEFSEVPIAYDLDHLSCGMMRRYQLLTRYDSVQALQPTKRLQNEGKCNQFADFHFKMTKVAVLVRENLYKMTQRFTSSRLVR